MKGKKLVLAKAWEGRFVRLHRIRPLVIVKIKALIKRCLWMERISIAAGNVP